MTITDRAAKPITAKRNINVRSYTRRSPTGQLIRVSAYSRRNAEHQTDLSTTVTASGASILDAPAPASCVGAPTVGSADPATDPEAASGWIEVRYIKRWRDRNGRKRSSYISAREGRAQKGPSHG